MTQLEFASFSDLIKNLAQKKIRQHSFSQIEMQLLLDVQEHRMRKGQRERILLTYFHAVQRSYKARVPVPSFSSFIARQRSLHDQNQPMSFDQIAA